MTTKLSVSIGQCSISGRKNVNQDSHGVIIPNGADLNTKGIAIAIADGISSSDVSDVASQTSIRSFLEDYYCTSDTWSVKSSAERVLQASNSWLYAQNQRDNQFRLDKDKGYVCTFTGLVFKSNTAYLFHVGDAQVVRFRGNKEFGFNAKILTEQHRRWVSGNKSFLARAMGINQPLEIDHLELSIEVGDVFVLATDGVYEHVSNEEMNAQILLNREDLDAAAKSIVDLAYADGSEDNLTVQVIRVDSLPASRPGEFLQRANDLPFPPELSARMEFDGYRIIRDIHKTSRSHLMLAQDIETSENVVIKSPSTLGRESPEYVERFLMEQWIANRLNNAHIIKSYRPNRMPAFCYVVTEFVDGQNLAQWMIDNPEPSLDEVRSIIEQAAIGLRAFHRQEMLHQDLRPNNIMIDSSGTVKIIDFGSTIVAGVEEAQTSVTPGEAMPGTAQFLAPEYFLGEFGTKRSDLYLSLIHI